MLVDKPAYFESHRRQSNSYHGSNLYQTQEDSAFVARFENVVFKSDFFTRLEILDLPINPFCFIFASSALLVNLL